MSEHKLLPCPFCGCRFMVVVPSEYDDGMYGVDGPHATGCIIRSIDFADFCSPELVAKFWNSRKNKGKFAGGDLVRKTKGSQWHGNIVGFYSTSLTPIGYAVESATEKGSVQIYPEAALEAWEVV